MAAGGNPGAQGGEACRQSLLGAGTSEEADDAENVVFEVDTEDVEEGAKARKTKKTFMIMRSEKQTEIKKRENYGLASAPC